MTIPPTRSHGQSGHLQDHNNISQTLNTYDSYLDQSIDGENTVLTGLIYSDAKSQASTINISTNLITTIDSFSVSAYRSAEYNVQLVQDDKYTTVKAVVVHNNSDAGICEYGKIELGGGIEYTLSADIIDSNAVLRITVPDGDVNPLTVKIYKIMINI